MTGFSHFQIKLELVLLYFLSKDTALKIKQKLHPFFNFYIFFDQQILFETSQMNTIALGAENVPSGPAKQKRFFDES